MRVVSIVALLMISAFIRLHHLDHESLWMDELRQVSYYPLEMPEVIQGAAEQSQPPLDYIIGHFIYKLFKSDAAVRLPAVLFGIGTVWLITIISSQLGGWSIALLIGMIATLLPFNIYYSQEARPYSIAIFLFLASLWALDKSISRTDKTIKKPFILFFISSLFLYSRALSPLIVITVFLFILVIWMICSFFSNEESSLEFRQNILFSMLALIFALIIYAPCFLYIVKKSGKYLSDNSIIFGLNNVLNGLGKFNFYLVWKVFAVQTEPLSYPIAFLLFLSPYFIWKMKMWKNDKIFSINPLVLPLSLFLHIVIFHGKTELPFRPPYAIYLLPLSLILSSVSMKGIWELTKNIKWVTLARSVYILSIIAFLIMTGRSTVVLKNHNIKSDWRGVSEYLNTHTNSKQLLIYKSLKPYGRPTFNGFYRYYEYGTGLISMAQMPYISYDVVVSDGEPVIILYKFKEHYLTPDSKYPILPLNKRNINVCLESIEKDDLFHIKKFEGFYVIRLKKRAGSFLNDAYQMIEQIINYMSNDSVNVEFHLAAAALAKMGKKPRWKYHLEKAKVFSGKRYRRKVEKIENFIRSLT